MKLQNEINKLNDLKSILKEVYKTSRVLNYEFDVNKANQSASKAYSQMIAFNHKYPSDAIKDRGIARRDDPYGISIYKSVETGSSSRIFGDSVMDLQTVENGASVDDNYQQELTDLIKPKIDRCEFIIKQQTCTQADIDKANQFVKQHKVTIKNPLTTTPVKDVKDSISLANDITHAAKARGKLVAEKDIIKLHAQWKNFLNQAPIDAKFDQDELKSRKDDYDHELGFYKSDTRLINHLQDLIHKYHNAEVLVKYYPHSGWDNNPVSDLRPAEISDLRKYTVKGNSFSLLYRNAMDALNSVDFNDIDGSLDRIHHAVLPIIKNDKFDSTDYYDLAIRTAVVKNAVTHDIPYQHSRTMRDEYQTEQEFTKEKQRFIAQDKKILKQIQHAGKYLTSDLIPYSAKTLKTTVSALKKDLLRTLFKVNKNNKNFDPQITVAQAHITISEVFENAVYAKDVRYKKRATDLIDWVAEKHPNAKISYRQLNPVGHYIYKRNINNIKKALA